ncbi:MAG: GTP-binding protein [Evtepia gabavorous]
MSTAVAPLEYKGCKINVLDTPGYFDFSGEVIEALQVADAAIIVCSAKAGISVGSGEGLEILPGAGYAPALSTSPRPTRRTATTTPPSTPCGSASATISPPWWSPSGTPTRRSPASSTCSTSAPMRMAGR